MSPLQNTILHVDGLRESAEEVSGAQPGEEGLPGEHNARQVDEHRLRGRRAEALCGAPARLQGS